MESQSIKLAGDYTIILEYGPYSAITGRSASEELGWFYNVNYKFYSVAIDGPFETLEDAVDEAFDAVAEAEIQRAGFEYYYRTYLSTAGVYLYIIDVHNDSKFLEQDIEYAEMLDDMDLTNLSKAERLIKVRSAVHHAYIRWLEQESLRESARA